MSLLIIDPVSNSIGRSTNCNNNRFPSRRQSKQWVLLLVRVSHGKWHSLGCDLGVVCYSVEVVVEAQPWL